MRRQLLGRAEPAQARSGLRGRARVARSTVGARDSGGAARVGAPAPRPRTRPGCHPH